MNWHIRPYREGDAAIIAATETACFEADGLDIVIATEELESDFQRLGVDLQSGILVVDGPRLEGLPERLLPGFAYVGMREDINTNVRTYYFRVSVHPLARLLGLERELLLRLVAMARGNESKPGVAPRDEVRVREDLSSKQQSQIQVYEAVGLKPLRTFWIMKCSLDDLPAPKPVEGVRIRPLRLPEDLLPSMDAFNGSFIDHYDFHKRTEKLWKERLHRPSFRPDLSWVGEVVAEPGKLAGLCLCGIFEEENEALGRKEGWIEALGTVRGWRGKGLGRALLLHGLRSLKDAGLDTGALDVDAENPTGATNLYKSAGFHVHDAWMDYGCALDEIDTDDRQPTTDDRRPNAE